MDPTQDAKQAKPIHHSLADISIRNPVFAWMIMAALIFFGLISFQRLGVSQLPNVDFPSVNIQVNWEGASPEVMETDVVDIIEEAVMGIQGVTNVEASARFGSASISVDFELERNIDLAMQDVQTKLSAASRKLPKDIDPPILSKNNPDDQPILWLAVSVDPSVMNMAQLMAFVRDNLKNQFSTLPGVAEVFLGGYVDPNLRVWVDSKKLQGFQLTVTDLITAIQNEHSEMPAGRIDTADKEFNVRVLGEATSLEQFGNLLISQRGGQPSFIPIRMNQVARVEEGLNEVRRISRFKGKPAVGLGIKKQRGSNAVAVADGVKAQLTKIQKDLPSGVQLTINFDSTKFIKESVEELLFTLFLSALLTSLVCWAFLGTWSSTFNVLMAIPTSIIGAFLGLYIFDFSLNTFTLLGLSLAIGIVVDDAIMVLENIMRHAEGGKDRVTAAGDGAREITFAAISATVAIAAIFLPVAFMKGVIGRFFFQFGITMTIAVFLSLLEALTLTPMRCASMLKVRGQGPVTMAMDGLMAKLAVRYSRGLAWCLDHRGLVLSVSSALFLGSLFLVIPLRKEMMPAQDQSLFMLRMRSEVGTKLSVTDESSKKAEAYLATRPDVERFFVAVGDMGGGGDGNQAQGFITLKPRKERKLSQDQIMEEVRRDLKQLLPAMKIITMDLSMRGFGQGKGYPLEFMIQGPEWEKLAQYSQEIMKRLEATKMVADMDSNYRIGQPEIRVLPHRAAAAARGVSVATIGGTINAMVGGVVVGKYSKGGHRFDIRVKMEDQGLSRDEMLRTLRLRNNRGELIPLSELVKLEERPTLQVINRVNKERALSVHANLVPGMSQEKLMEEARRIGKELLPLGYRLTFSGSSESYKTTMMGLFFALLVGIAVSYMVLASQFNSFIHPATVLLAMPFSVTGAFIALLISNQSLNMFSFIGIILLMGIVKKNSILLVDFTNQKRAEALGITEALKAACPQRLRPILMTSIATVAGAIPAALAFGPGAETRIPMAITVIGGVILSTFLTLFVVPCAYSLLARFERSS